MKANQIDRLRRFFRRRVSPRAVISPELARDMADLSVETGRQIGLLLDRAGTVVSVVVGDAGRLVLPEMGRARGGLTRLKGLRLVHTHLGPEGLNQDDLNDLAQLRLDLIAALVIPEADRPPAIDAAYLLPAGGKGQGIARAGADHVALLDIDFNELIVSLEEEFNRRHGLDRATGGGDLALLIGVSTAPRAEAEDRLAELAELADTAGLVVVEKLFYRPRSGKPGRLLSQYRVNQLNILALQTGVDLLVFDQNLSPAQITRLTRQTELRIIDRTQLILDIFAQRARTREGKIQVEMAQLQYLSPRLGERDDSLSRLTGGIGGRGPGETKLEIDRRRVRERIARLKKDLGRIKAARGQRRDRRARVGLPIVSIVGYTNAGKSTLLNHLTRSEVLAEDQLFATLDPTSRRLKFPQDRAIIITDTVGFISDLPPELIEAFSATLEELQSADLLLHVIDASNPAIDSQVGIVEDLLARLNLAQIPVLRVLNKIDLVDPELAGGLAERFDAVALSALDSSTFPPLIESMAQRLGLYDSTLRAFS